jgi:hypothetical protein
MLYKISVSIHSIRDSPNSETTQVKILKSKQNGQVIWEHELNKSASTENQHKGFCSGESFMEQNNQKVTGLKRKVGEQSSRHRQMLQRSNTPENKGAIYRKP